MKSLLFWERFIQLEGFDLPLGAFRQELAELLGQVKPPTASKEDIDNSGLEVIRSGVLTEYEKVGRIAPMCVDRVRLPFCCF